MENIVYAIGGWLIGYVCGILHGYAINCRWKKKPLFEEIVVVNFKEE